MDDFKLKDIDCLFVVVVLIRFSVVFQPIKQKILVWLPRLPMNTSNNICGHLKDNCFKYTYQTNRCDFLKSAQKSCRFSPFWGKVDHFHLMQSNALVEVGICTHCTLGFGKNFSMPFCACDVKVLNETHILKNWVYQKKYYVESFLICSILLKIKFFQQIELSNHQRIHSLVLCCHETGIASLFLFASFVALKN